MQIVSSSGTSGHGSGLILYSQRHMMIDSNVFIGYFTGDCVEFKGGGTTGDTNAFNTIRYNVMKPTRFYYPASASACPGRAGIGIWYSPYSDSIYGNIIYGGTTPSNYSMLNGIHFMGGWRSPASGIFCYNNTIYNVYDGVNGYVESDPPVPDKRFKYNLVYNGGSDYEALIKLANNDASYWSVIDSNMYYAADTTFKNEDSPLTLTQWRALGFDVHSTLGTNPQFDSPFTGARSGQNDGASTFLGNNYGAWQSGGSSGTKYLPGWMK
jgi:hypothetical protein